MFGKSSGKQATKQVTPPVPAARPERRKEQSLLQTGVSLRGEMQVDGDLRIEGTVRADLDVRGTLLVGGPAEVEGQLLGHNIVIHGRVSGTLRAAEQIRLAEGARVRGDLYCKSLVIEEGVIFEGRSHMGEAQTGASTGGPRRAQAPKEEALTGQSSRASASAGAGGAGGGSPIATASGGGGSGAAQNPGVGREPNMGRTTASGKSPYQAASSSPTSHR